LKIQKGKTIAIVGASGAGKSTLVDLIPRFHDVTSGEILIDGHNIKNYQLNDLRSLMGIVSQEPVLFNDTIRNNIALGGNTNDINAIQEAAKVANAIDFIQKKEQGFETIVGDRGSKLSGGEKQRVTIARAIFKNPPVLILDEADQMLEDRFYKQVMCILDMGFPKTTKVALFSATMPKEVAIFGRSSSIIGRYVSTSNLTAGVNLLKKFS
jgi:subfamily B ATP-binding cassette protein MsbA